MSFVCSRPLPDCLVPAWARHVTTRLEERDDGAYVTAAVGLGRDCRFARVSIDRERFGSDPADIYEAIAAALDMALDRIELGPTVRRTGMRNGKWCAWREPRT